MSADHWHTNLNYNTLNDPILKYILHYFVKKEFYVCKYNLENYSSDFDKTWIYKLLGKKYRSHP